MVEDRPGAATREAAPATQPLPGDTRGMLPARPIRLRAVLLGVAVIPPNLWWIVSLEVNRWTFPTYAAPFYSCIFTLLVLTAANSGLQRRLPSWALNRAELLAIYSMLCIPSALASINCMQVLLGVMGHAFWFASPENRWAELFLPRLPPWLTVSNLHALEGYYAGNSSLYRPDILKAWAVPVLCWSGFGTVWLGTMLCINVLFRHQWMHAERLSFPIVQLPLEMTAEGGGFWRARSMWAGFAIAAALTLVHGVHAIFPDVPNLPLKRTTAVVLFSDRPWNAIGGLNLSIYLLGIGLAFLMPLDAAFSCVFFFWALKAQAVLGSATGWSFQTRPGGGFDSAFPYALSQSFGAYMAVFVLSIWGVRRHFGRVWRTAWGLPGGLDDRGEPISYRLALLGVALGGALLVAFGIAAGFTWWVSGIFFLVYFALAVLITRVRAEVGLPIHDLHVMGPHSILVASSGTQALGPRNLTVLSLFYWFNRVYASHPMPHQMEAFKLGERAGAPGHRLAGVLVLAAAIGFPCVFWALLDNAYRTGCATARVNYWGAGFGIETFTRLQSWLTNPVPPNYPALVSSAGGFALAMGLSFLRARFPSFPLHPLGYAVAASWGMAQLWPSMALGVLAKFTLLRLGGLKVYRAAIPFFLGLILGGIAVFSLWTLVSIAAGFYVQDFWP